MHLAQPHLHAQHVQTSHLDCGNSDIPSKSKIKVNKLSGQANQPST